MAKTRNNPSGADAPPPISGEASGAGAEEKMKRERVRKALNVCGSGIACEACPEWNENETCGMTGEYQEIMDKDEELIRFLAKQWEEYWYDAAEKSSFEPEKMKFRIAAKVREKLAEYGF